MNGRLQFPVLLMRLLVGWVFVVEGLLKFVWPDDLGVGRFAAIGIPAPNIMAPFVGVVEIVCVLMVLAGLLPRLAAIPLLIDISVAILSTKIPILLGHGFWHFTLPKLKHYGLLSMLHEARTDFSMVLWFDFSPHHGCRELVIASAPISQEHYLATSRQPRDHLAQKRGEVGQGEKGGINFFGQFAVHFGFFLNTLPLRILLEGFPVGGCLFAAGMLQDVDQGIAFQWLIYRCPVSDTLDSMPVKKLDRVIAEARQQFSQFSRGRVIDPEFVNHGRRLLRIRVVLLRSGPKRSGKKCRRRKRLEQCSSFHGTHSSRRLRQCRQLRLTMAASQLATYALTFAVRCSRPAIAGWRLAEMGTACVCPDGSEQILAKGLCDRGFNKFPKKHYEAGGG